MMNDDKSSSATRRGCITNLKNNPVRLSGLFQQTRVSCDVNTGKALLIGWRTSTSSLSTSNFTHSLPICSSSSCLCGMLFVWARNCNNSTSEQNTAGSTSTERWHIMNKTLAWARRLAEARQQEVDSLKQHQVLFVFLFDLQMTTVGRKHRCPSSWQALAACGLCKAVCFKQSVTLYGLSTVWARHTRKVHTDV